MDYNLETGLYFSKAIYKFMEQSSLYVENGNCCLQKRKNKKKIFRFCPTFDMSYLNIFPHQKCKKHFCCNLFWFCSKKPFCFVVTLNVFIIFLEIFFCVKIKRFFFPASVSSFCDLLSEKIDEEIKKNRKNILMFKMIFIQRPEICYRNFALL